MNTTTALLERPSAAPDTLGAAPARLERLRRRIRKGIWIEALGVFAMLCVAFVVPDWLTDRSLRLEWIYRALLLASFVAVAVRVMRARLFVPLAVDLTDEEVALAVERRAPDLKQQLISSLQFERDLRAGGVRESPALMSAVIAELRTRVTTIPFARAVDSRRIRRFGAAIAAAIAFFGAWAALDAHSLGLWARRNVLLSNVEWPRYTTLSFADAAAGEVRVPQGDALTVRVAATVEVPDQVFLDCEFATGERAVEPMSRTGDGEFTWTIDAVLGDATLSAQGGDALAATLRVRVVERPRIDELTVRAVFPDYMEREPFVVPATEGELKLPRGAKLTVQGHSHKPIDEAFLLFGSDHKVLLDRHADGFGFDGGFAPEASGLLVIDVIDRDRLGAGAPPKLLLRVGDDKGPTLEFRLRGIGSAITAHARIPGDLKIKDDFGVREVRAEIRAATDAPVDAAPGAGTPPPADVPFEDAAAVFGSPLEPGTVRHETTASVDLRQWNKVPDENAAANLVRPGMLFSLRFAAKDNFGPGDPHEGFSETMSFRVVTREKLTEELRRRQVEQRQELQRILDEEHAATSELRELANPAQAGERQKLVEARLQTMARQQQALGRRAAFVAETYERILLEYENNRLIEPNSVRQLEARITEPLTAVAKEAFPATSRLVSSFAATGQEQARASAVDGYTDIEQRLAAVLKEMAQAETLAALLEDLRLVIIREDEAIRDVRSQVENRERDVFGPGKDKK